MKYKKTVSIGTTSYQCYDDHRHDSIGRVARIDEPFDDRLKGDSASYIVTFVGDSANGYADNLLRIANKIKKISKSYRDKKEIEE